MNGRPLCAKPGSVKTTKNLLTHTDYFFSKITFWTSLAFAMFSLFCCNIFSIAWRPLLIVSAFLLSTYWGEFCKISELTCQSKEKTTGENTKICLFLCTTLPKILKFFVSLDKSVKNTGMQLHLQGEALTWADSTCTCCSLICSH